eukprot:203740-Rhodomonas_salina.1
MTPSGTRWQDHTRVSARAHTSNAQEQFINACAVHQKPRNHHTNIHPLGTRKLDHLGSLSISAFVCGTLSIGIAFSDLDKGKFVSLLAGEGVGGQKLSAHPQPLLCQQRTIGCVRTAWSISCICAVLVPLVAWRHTLCQDLFFLLHGTAHAMLAPLTPLHHRLCQYRPSATLPLPAAA